MKKLLVSLVALAAVLSATACDSASGPALTVNGTDVSQSTVEREFEALLDNQVLAEQGQIAGEGDDTVNSEVAAFWLTLRVQQEVIDDELRQRDIEVTAADREAGQAAIEQEIGAEIFGAFPDWLQERLQGRYARRAALLTALGGPAEGPTDEEVRAEFDRAFAQLQADCASGKFVSHILVATQPEADAIAAELAAGASFAEIARTRSQDTGSAEVGGELFCYDPTQLDPTFVATADTLAIGQVSAPVQTQFGFHIIRMSDTIAFESVEQQVRESLEPPGNTNPELDALIADAKVRVDPRYGTWEVRDGQGLVEPPASAADSSPASTAPAPTSAP